MGDEGTMTFHGKRALIKYLKAQGADDFTLAGMVYPGKYGPGDRVPSYEEMTDYLKEFESESREYDRMVASKSGFPCMEEDSEDDGEDEDEELIRCLIGGHEKSGLERALARVVGRSSGSGGLTEDDYRDRCGGWIDLPTEITHEPFRERATGKRRKPLGCIPHGEFRKGSSRGMGSHVTGSPAGKGKPVKGKAVTGKDDELEAKRDILMEAWKSMNGGTDGK